MTRRHDDALRAGLLLVAAAVATPDPAVAVFRLEPEEEIAQLLKLPPASEVGGTASEKGALAGRRFAALPQVGFGPETGLLGGLKLTDRDVFGSGVTLDVEGTWAVQGQQSLSLDLATPTLAGFDLPMVLRVAYDRDPRRRFFGLGNNQQGPTPASSHEIQTVGGSLTLGWRIVEDLSLNLQAGAWQSDIRDGERVDGAPPTPDRFPELPGIDGGRVIPFAASFVYNQRGDLTRPVSGWRALAKAMYVSSDLGSDFDYARFLVDVGYLHPFFGDRLVLGGRVGWSWLAGSFEKIPFWALAPLGGADTLRGYFPYRFLGTSRLWTNLEARGLLFDFDFFDIWHVEVDGAGFVDIGRVFVDDSDLEVEGPLDPSLETNDDLRIAYGGGVRFALSEAIIARVDVGFSDEESGLVYLTFGHTF